MVRFRLLHSKETRYKLSRIRTAKFFITNFIHFQKVKNFTILKVAACRLGGMHTGFDGMHVGFDGMHIGLALFMLVFRYAPILARFSTICTL